ncbi:MAG: DUF6673 family protein [Paraclostridium sp.]
MRINGVKFENFDIMDADVAILTEMEMEKLSNTKVPEGVSWTEVITLQCDSTFKFFDAVFGEGSADKIFKGKRNLRLCVDCIDEFKKEFDREIKIETEKVKTKTGMYSANRAQRRNKK